MNKKQNNKIKDLRTEINTRLWYALDDVLGDESEEIERAVNSMEDLIEKISQEARKDNEILINTILETKSEEIKESKQNLIKEILEEIEKTKDKSFAFMTMTDEKGKLEDWTIPASEIKKIIENL